MTVLEVLKFACKYLGENELLSTTTLGGDMEPSLQQIDKINTLIDCVNDTVETLAIMYFPLKYEEMLSSSNNIYSFDNFTKPVVEILKVLDNHLKYEVDYAMFADHFEAKSGDLRVIYTYLPSNASDVNDTLEVVENKVTPRMVALGVVSRYFLIVGMYQDSSSWQEMFERVVLVAQRRKDNVVIKKRRWL